LRCLYAHRELDLVTDTPEITLPSFLTMAVPILGTPYFHECVRKQRLLPRTKLRDMDGLTLVMEPLDSRDETIAFLRDLTTMRGYRRRVLRHALAFAKRYRSRLTTTQMMLALSNAALLATPGLATAFKGAGFRAGRARPRTYISTTEPLDDVYTPKFPVDARYRHYFEPLMVTDAEGGLSEDLQRSGVLGGPLVTPRRGLRPG
jgi:hypothetical protein